MTSRLFGRLFEDAESRGARQFARDLAECLELSPGEREACLEALPRLRAAETKSQRTQLTEQLSDNLKLPYSNVEHAVSVLDFLLSAFLKRDIPDSDSLAWAEDLTELGFLNDTTRSAFESVVDSIKSELVARVQPAERRRRAAAGVGPTFAGCGVTVEVRSVRKDFYRRGTPVDEFDPQVLDTVTVASISMSVDEGPFKEIYFQASEDDLDYLISMFTAAKKEMGALRQYLRLEH